MPTYEYECTACKHRFEQFQKFSDPPVDSCPECGSPVRKVLFPAGVVFKGSGWYITDSRKSTPSEGGSSDSKTETKTEAKSETKAEAKSDSSPSSSAKATKSEGSAPPATKAGSKTG